MSVRHCWIRSRFLPWTASLWVAVNLLLAWPVSGWAEELVQRKVLAFYNHEAGETPLENFIFDGCQMVLNYYGLLTEYRDINSRPLPDHQEMRDYRGVILSLERPQINEPEEFLQWLIRQARVGRKMVVLGGVHTLTDRDGNPVSRDLANEAYKHLGLSYQGEETRNRAVIRSVFKDREWVEFERPYPGAAEFYLKLRPTDERVRSHLSLERTDRPDSLSAVVITGRAGGLAWGTYVKWHDPGSFRKQWYLNPFRFFGQSFGIQGLPVPDPTTLNGLRVAISHIDGDGFTGLSRLDRKSSCAEIIRDEILKRYEFPVTVSVITGEIDPSALGEERFVRQAREIFALPNVEPASHSHSHPFYWNPYYTYKDSYDHQYGLSIPGYYSHDPEIEIDYSVRYISQELCPPGKTCRVFLWSGACDPLESDIARADALGLFNMNGGDSVYDDVQNSYTSVAPLYRQVGKRFQFHTGQANDNILTNLWQGPFHGYRNIITTMERTDRPRRVAALNVYYHFFSAEYRASLKALQEVYEWVLSQDIAPMFTSEYIKMARGYLDTRIYRKGEGIFILENYQDCLTVRFDQIDLVPDMLQSTNILGYAREPQGLYVSLVPGTGRAVIVLSSPDGPGTTPYLQKASGWVSEFKREERSVRLQYRGFGRGRLEIAGLRPDQVLSIKGSALDKPLSLRANQNGVLFVKGIRSGGLEIDW